MTVNFPAKWLFKKFKGLQTSPFLGKNLLTLTMSDLPKEKLAMKLLLSSNMKMSLKFIVVTQLYSDGTTLTLTLIPKTVILVSIKLLSRQTLKNLEFSF